MEPKDLTLDHELHLLKLLNELNIKIKKLKFKVGDQVRVSRLKTIFEKGHTPNWSSESFAVVKVQKTKPITYKLKDYQDQSLDGCFYEFELLKVKNPHVYLVEKVIKKRGDQVFVKWLGFDNTHNSWINKSSM